MTGSQKLVPEPSTAGILGEVETVEILPIPDN
jgi:hypothetical protein